VESVTTLHTRPITHELKVIFFIITTEWIIILNIFIVVHLLGNGGIDLDVLLELEDIFLEELDDDSWLGAHLVDQQID